MILDLTPEMAANARAFDAWHCSIEASLQVKRDRRPARSAAAKLGHQRKRGVAA